MSCCRRRLPPPAALRADAPAWRPRAPHPASGDFPPAHGCRRPGYWRRRIRRRRSEASTKLRAKSAPPTSKTMARATSTTTRVSRKRRPALPMLRLPPTWMALTRSMPVCRSAGRTPAIEPTKTATTPAAAMRNRMIDPNVPKTREVGGSQRLNRGGEHPPHEQAQESTNQREHDALGKDLPQQTGGGPAPSAARVANSRARVLTREEQQVRDVGAGDHQDQTRAERPGTRVPGARSQSSAPPSNGPEPPPAPPLRTPGRRRDDRRPVHLPSPSTSA